MIAIIFSLLWGLGDITKIILVFDYLRAVMIAIIFSLFWGLGDITKIIIY